MISRPPHPGDTALLLGAPLLAVRMLIAVRNARLMRTLRAVPGVTDVAQGLPPIGQAERFIIKKLKANDRSEPAAAASETACRGVRGAEAPEKISARE